MLYKLTPLRYKLKMKHLLDLSGSKRKPKNFFNISFGFSLVISLAMGIVLREYLVFVVPLLFLALFAFFHGMVILAVDRRARFVESILPDALQLVSANSRAGYIPSRALILSARKEFGPLSDAIKQAGKDMMTGTPLEDALRRIPRKIKSKTLEKTIELIIDGGKSGGHFATLLEENAEDIRRTQVLEKEIRANVVMYIIFIGFAGAIAAPVLYSLSGFLIATITQIGGSAALPDQVFSNMQLLQFGGLEIGSDFLYWFSIIAIFITTFFGGIILGAISSGNERAGIKFVPIFMIVAFAVYFITNIFIGGLFGAFLPGT